MTRYLHAVLWLKRISQVRQQGHHLPHPNCRVFRHHHVRTQLRAALLLLRAILVRRHALSYDNKQQHPRFPSMCSNFVNGNLECGAFVEPAVAPRAADSPTPVVAFACTLGTKRTKAFALCVFVAFCFCALFLSSCLLSLLLQCISTFNSMYFTPKRAKPE